MPKKDKKVPEDKKYTYYNERRQSKKEDIYVDKFRTQTQSGDYPDDESG